MKYLLIAACLLFSQILYSQNTCPVSYKKDPAGNLCSGADGQIRLYFNNCPATAPILDSIYIYTTKLNFTYSAPNSSECAQKGNVTYCIYGGTLSSSPGLRLYLHYPNSSTMCYLPEASALPIVMGSFTARRSGSNVLLNWEVQHEIHSSVFEVERAYGNEAFQTIGTVPNHSGSTLLNYSFTDITNNSNGITYYRINMIDRNGSFTYSDIRAIKSLYGTAGLVVYPNPSVGSAKISVTEMNEATNVHVLDATGRVVRSVELTTSNTAEINGLAKGNYIIRSVGKITGQVTVSKLTVIN